MLVYQLPTPEPFLFPQRPQMLSDAGLLPSCFWHFYLFNHKALEGGDLGMSSCLHNCGGREERWELMPAFLQNGHFCTSPTRLTAPPPGRVVKPWLVVGNCWEYPRIGLGLWAELWRLDLSVARETSVSPRKETTALWLLRHSFPPPKK